MLLIYLCKFLLDIKIYANHFSVITEIPITERPPSCTPSPCGPNSLCQIISGNPACSCLPNYIGVPPQCRPECILSTECKSHLACVNQRCADPCPGSCGINAQCHVLNHLPVCTCMEGFTGDPFTQCSIIPPGKNIEQRIIYMMNKYFDVLQKINCETKIRLI